MNLSNIAYIVTDNISSQCIELDQYVTTDSILQNKMGRKIADNLPPQPCSLTKYAKGDILIANIRPYLKKIWYADIDGGCSKDVLVFRAKKKSDSAYLYSILLQDGFYDYVMKAPMGSKMPRGNPEHAIRFPIAEIDEVTKNIAGDLCVCLDKKIAANNEINDNLAA